MIGDSVYDTTTCTVGDDLILPTPPIKYGYHFVGWRETTIYGSWSQSGTPTPTNPIEPVFKSFNNTVLRAVGSGDNLIADSYDPETRTVTRRIGIKVLTGTETWWDHQTDRVRATLSLPGGADVLCSHLKYDGTISTGNKIYTAKDSSFTQVHTDPVMDAVTWKSFLADQYDARTPVTVYYPLATPVEETLQ